jgi:hypothetical protein
MSFLWQGAAFRKRKRRPQARPSGKRRSSQERKPKEARSGQPEGRSARQRRKPKPNPLSFKGPAELEASGRKEPRKDCGEVRLIEVRQGTFNSKPQGREDEEPAREPKPAARRGAGPAGTGTGPAMDPRRKLRDRPGPQGLGRNLPGKGGLAFGQDQRNQGQWRPAEMPASISFGGGAAARLPSRLASPSPPFPRKPETGPQRPFSLNRRPGPDPGSASQTLAIETEGGCRIKSGMTNTSAVGARLECVGYPQARE